MAVPQVPQATLHLHRTSDKLRTVVSHAVGHHVPHGQHLDASLAHHAPELCVRRLGRLQVDWPLVQRCSGIKVVTLSAATELESRVAGMHYRSDYITVSL